MQKLVSLQVRVERKRFSTFVALERLLLRVNNLPRRFRFREIPSACAIPLLIKFLGVHEPGAA